MSESGRALGHKTAETRKSSGMESLCASLRERLARAETFPPAWTDEHPTPSEAQALLDHIAGLEEALRRVLDWPLPIGDVETWVLPKWLAKIAHDALGDEPKVPAWR